MAIKFTNGNLNIPMVGHWTHQLLNSMGHYAAISENIVKEAFTQIQALRGSMVIY